LDDADLAAAEEEAFYEGELRTREAALGPVGLLAVSVLLVTCPGLLAEH
jgi:hypothetical protein